MRETGEKGGEGKGATQKTLKSIYCGLFPGSTTAGCLPSRLAEIVISLMYILSSTRPNILLPDRSRFGLTRPLKRQLCQMFK